MNSYRKFRKTSERGTGLGIGGTDTCICPQCDYKEEKERGIPCNKRICPKCNIPLIGEGMPHGKGKGV